MKEKQGTDRSIPWMPDPGHWYAGQDIVPLAAHPCLEDRINALKGEVRLAGRELETAVREYEDSRATGLPGVRDTVDPDAPRYERPADGGVLGHWDRVWRVGDTVYGADFVPAALRPPPVAFLGVRDCGRHDRHDSHVSGLSGEQFRCPGAEGWVGAAVGRAARTAALQGGQEVVVRSAADEQASDDRQDAIDYGRNAWPTDWRGVAWTAQTPGANALREAVARVSSEASRYVSLISRTLAQTLSALRPIMPDLHVCPSDCPDHVRPSGGVIGGPGRTDDGDTIPFALSPGGFTRSSGYGAVMDETWLLDQVQDPDPAYTPDARYHYRSMSDDPAQYSAMVRAMALYGEFFVRVETDGQPIFLEPDVRGGHH